MLTILILLSSVLASGIASVLTEYVFRNEYKALIEAYREEIEQ